MDQVYDIVFDEKKVGIADVEREGLYYHFRCKCRLPETGIYSIQVSCDGKDRNLGICVPIEGHFGVDTKVPVKYIGEGILSFQAISKYANTQEEFYPLNPAEPFGDWQLLENAYFCIMDGQPGIRIKAVKD